MVGHEDQQMNDDRYTPEQLRAAWHVLMSSREHWPATFEEAMSHPLYSRLVRIQAFHGLVETVIRHRDIGPAHVDAAPYPGPWSPSNLHRSGNFSPDERREHLRSQSFPVTKRATPDPCPTRRSIDRKSLAAGEKPEDSDF